MAMQVILMVGKEHACQHQDASIEYMLSTEIPIPPAKTDILHSTSQRARLVRQKNPAYDPFIGSHFDRIMEAFILAYAALAQLPWNEKT